MSEKTFKLSKNYRKLWELLKGGATVVYQVTLGTNIKEVGLIDKSMCQHIQTSLRYRGEDGLQAWRDISLSEFTKECRRLNLEFFEEVESPKLPEPNMFWDSTSPEEEADPDEIATNNAPLSPESPPEVVQVLCARRLPDRKMKVWTTADNETRWEWVDETLTKSTHP